MDRPSGCLPEVYSSDTGVETQVTLVGPDDGERSECFGYGEVVDVFLQARRDVAPARRFLKRILKFGVGRPR